MIQCVIVIYSNNIPLQLHEFCPMPIMRLLRHSWCDSPLDEVMNVLWLHWSHYT